MQQLSHITRRNALKAAGGLGAAAAGGLGLLATASPAAAISTNFRAAGPVVITDDQGDVTEVFVNPHSRVEWTGFDEEVVKVRQLLEAQVVQDGSVVGPFLSETNGGTAATEAGWWPVYRETPWLFETDVGPAEADFDYTSGSSDTPARIVTADDGLPSYAVSAVGGTTGHIEYDLVPSSDPTGRGLAEAAILLASEAHPNPDYATSSGDTGTTVLLEGTSIGSHDFANGAYGTVSDTSSFDNLEDGTPADTVVKLRLTTSLHTVWDFVEVNPTGETNDSFAPLVMGNAPDVSPRFSTPHDLTYEQMQSAATSHPAIDVAEASFTVTADNIAAELGSSSDANPGGS